MNKKNLFKMFFLIPLILSNNAYAQLSMEKQNKEVTIPNSQSYNIIKYGNVGANLYTGTVNYNLPVYTYKDKDFEIPISLSYSSNGYRPNSRAGEVGLDWSLVAGGVITREVKGIPDEKTQFTMAPNQLGRSHYGFCYIYSDSVSQENLFPQVGITESGNIYFYNENEAQTVAYEQSPDIYHFNFMGYQGSFHLWYNKEIKIFNTNTKNGLKIEASSPGFDSQITIIFTTGDGYKYVFEASDVSQEYTQRTDEYLQIQRDYQSWKLNSITAPNGRTVTFYYGTPNYVPGYNGVTYNYQPSSTYAYNIFGSFQGSTSNMLSINYTPLRTWPLTKIEISQGPTIHFKYISTTGEKKRKLDTPYYEDAITAPKLTKIYALNGTDTLCRCNLTYKTSYVNTSYISTLQNTVYFLGSVDKKGEGVYDFEYNNRTQGGFPCLGSFSVDHWGYYNGANDGLSVSNFLDYITYNADQSETIGTTIRNSNSNFASMGLLNKITFPTGGYTTLEYEPHSYSKKIIRNDDNDYIPELVPLQANYNDVGGLRIKRVSDYNSDNTLLNRKRYIYDVAGSSTGALLNNPRYGVSYYANGNGYTKFKQYASLYDIYSYDKTHIEYSEVVEKYNDSSEVVYSFANYDDYPDLVLFATDEATQPMPTEVVRESDDSYTYIYYIITTGARNIKNILSPLSSEQTMRGVLKEKTVKSSSGSTLNTESNSYSYFNEFTYEIPMVVGEDYRMIGRKDFNSIQTNSSTTEFFSGQSISKQNKYGYNTKGQTSRISTLDSKGDSLITKYTYVTDLPSNQITYGSVYKSMLDYNIINYPLKEEVYLKKSGSSSETLISGKRYTYITPVATNTKIIKISKIESYDYSNSTWYTEIEYTDFDNQGNALSSRDKNGLYSCYVWGYNGLYLVAKVEGGLSLNNLQSAISGLSSINTTPLSGAMVAGAQNTLKAIWPGIKMTVYEYIPFVGLSKITDPSGKVTEYQYNASSKLKNQKDTKGITHNEYYYSPDNKL
jgi:YD repeat-containing protein